MTVRITFPRLVAAVLLIGTVAIATGATRMEKVQRYGAVIGVKKEKLDYYKELHAKPWATVNRAIKDANIRNYSIYLTQFDDGNWYLFSYFEYTGNDFEADMKKLGADADTQRWWKETDPCQVALKNREKGEWWKTMQEVYHLN